MEYQQYTKSSNVTQPEHESPEEEKLQKSPTSQKSFAITLKICSHSVFFREHFPFFSMIEKGQEEKGLTVLGHHTTRVFSDVKALIPALKLLKKNTDPFPDPVRQ